MSKTNKVKIKPKEIKMEDYKIHPLCMLFPWMDVQTFSILKKDIEKYGQRDKIKVYQEQVLDGKNRLRALIDLGIEPKTEVLPEDTDPIAYIKAIGLCRRDLNTVLRVEIAQKIEEYRLSQLKKEEQEKRKELKEEPKTKEPLEEEEIKRIATDARSTEKTVKKIIKIQEKAKEDPKAQEVYENMKKENIKSIASGFRKVIGTIEKKKPTIQQKEASKNELKEELATARFEIKRLTNLNSRLIKLKEKLIDFINRNGLWEKARKELGFPEKEESYEPTIKEVRKSKA
ncbi:MAG: hypothetical protein ACFFDN_00110 [Candidatus Hodarchaeota archaeon]